MPRPWRYCRDNTNNTSIRARSLLALSLSPVIVPYLDGRVVEAEVVLVEEEEEEVEVAAGRLEAEAELRPSCEAWTGKVGMRSGSDGSGFSLKYRCDKACRAVMRLSGS